MLILDNWQFVFRNYVTKRQFSTSLSIFSVHHLFFQLISGISLSHHTSKQSNKRRRDCFNLEKMVHGCGKFNNTENTWISPLEDGQAGAGMSILLYAGSSSLYVYFLYLFIFLYVAFLFFSSRKLYIIYIQR